MIINIPLALEIIANPKKRKKYEKLETKLNEWLAVYNHLGKGYEFHPGYIAIKVGETR